MDEMKLLAGIKYCNVCGTFNGHTGKCTNKTMFDLYSDDHNVVHMKCGNIYNRMAMHIDNGYLVNNAGFYETIGKKIWCNGCWQHMKHMHDMKTSKLLKNGCSNSTVNKI